MVFCPFAVYRLGSPYVNLHMGQKKAMFCNYSSWFISRYSNSFSILYTKLFIYICSSLRKVMQVTDNDNNIR